MKKFMIMALMAGAALFYSCSEEPTAVEGCTDSSAQNHNPDATKDDGSCTYASSSGNGSGSGSGSGSGTINATAKVNKGNGDYSTGAAVFVNNFCDNGYDYTVYEGSTKVAEGTSVRVGESQRRIAIDKGSTKSLTVTVSYSYGSDTETKCAGKGSISFGPYTVEREDEIEITIGK